MEQFEIPKVRLKFRQFLSYYAVNPDRWLLDPPFRYQSEAPNVFIVRLDLEFVQALDSVILCRDEYSNADTAFMGFISWLWRQGYLDDSKV